MKYLHETSAMMGVFDKLEYYDDRFWLKHIAQHDEPVIGKNDVLLETENNIKEIQNFNNTSGLYNIELSTNMLAEFHVLAGTIAIVLHPHNYSFKSEGLYRPTFPPV